MRVCSLASGSKGNLTYVESNKCKILVDIGLTLADTEARLRQIGIEPSEIKGILITHEHSDHIGGLSKFVKKYSHIKVFLQPESKDIILAKQPLPKENVISVSGPFGFDDIIVFPVPCSHDTLSCVGFVLESSTNRISIITDTGYMRQEAIDKMLESDIIYIEANYNEEMLLNNKEYSDVLKRRIMSNKGHLSNTACAEAIMRLMQGGTKQFVLAHLSEKNNSPMVAINQISGLLLDNGITAGEDVFLDMTFQDRIGHMFRIKE